MSTPLSLEALRGAVASVAEDAGHLDVFSSDAEAKDLPAMAARRRATRRGGTDPVQRAVLYQNRAGVLDWRLDPALEGGSPAAGGVSTPGRRARRAASAGGEEEANEALDGKLVDVFEYEPLDGNAVTAFLERVDQRLNAKLAQAQRLWRLQHPGGAGVAPLLQPVTAPLQGNQRRLLFVHGTFSKGEAFLDGIARARNGAAWLARAHAHYADVLFFEHPTLAVSPLMNALDLQRELLGVSGPLDIVAHSRGGLVVRWLLEALGVNAPQVRAVLVGSPLGGTSLASPPRLKATLALLSNYGAVLKATQPLAMVHVPLLLVPLAILRVASAMAGAAARTPLLDGVLALIPGLAAQSRVGNNAELRRLHAVLPRPAVTYAAVASNFEPEDPGWRFWQWFRGRRIANLAADRVFPGENDLVVDTASMSEGPMPLVARRDFTRSATVHHTNYFEQDATLDFIARQFQMP